ncbi:hypothetical protein NFI96_013131, partial [Prochilodus magdalenae]
SVSLPYSTVKPPTVQSHSCTVQLNPPQFSLTPVCSVSLPYSTVKPPTVQSHSCTVQLNPPQFSLTPVQYS